MIHPAKWRETADPFQLPFHGFVLKEVLGYPHAGNDVFQVRGEHDGREVEAYIKVARHRDANIRREVELLRQIHHPYLPRLLDWGEDFTWSVTEAMPGQRLSVLVGENTDGASVAYMEAYGEMLAQLHQLQGDFPDAPRRRFMDVRDAERCEAVGMTEERQWLLDHPVAPGQRCFCHGDGHYANLLWEDHHVSAVLDLELAGMDDREYDMAWAIIRRPGQRFMTTDEELRRFLQGYSRCGSYDARRLRWYMINSYVWFCQEDDAEYIAWVKDWIRRTLAEES